MLVNKEVRNKKIIKKYTVDKTSLFTSKSIWFVLVTSFLYLTVSYTLIGFKMEQVVLLLFFIAFYFSSHVTRKLILGFSIFILYWILFDYMKAFPNYRYSPVHMESLYNLEKYLFGIHWNGKVITPNEFLNRYTAPWLNVLTGIFYLCWVAVPLLFAGVLFFKNKKYFFYFSLTFFLVNIIGFIGYYAYPAAAPWYVARHGFVFNAATPGNTAGLARFDSFFGVQVFESIYSKSSNVFAAMPSLHAAYMVIVLYYGIKTKMKGYNYLFALIMLGIWFSAVYNFHHYVVDVLAGIICAAIGIFLFEKFAVSKKGTRIINYLVNITS